MAGKALAALCFLVALLQVRAQINCFSDSTCGGGGDTPTDFSSALDCCLQDDPSVLRSYAPADGSAACQPCFVIGFENANEQVKENVGAAQEINVQTITPFAELESATRNAMLAVTVQVNQGLSTATFGVDYSFPDFTGDSTMISGRASRELPAAISFELVNDVEPGEVEVFVLELTGAQLTRGDGVALEVLIANSVTVAILDNDIIEVQFKESEFSVEESVLKRVIDFTITNPINVDTHFVVRAMTYKEYDEEYEELSMTYSGLQQNTLENEYDQAELEDFVSRRIPFTIPANTREPNQSVEIVVVDDDMFEPREEGFRLLLIVDEARTPKSQVTFNDGRQLALFRIDDLTDTITLGFENSEMIIDEPTSSRAFGLPLVIRNNGSTEIDMTLRVNDDTPRDSAQVGTDYQDFENGVVEVHYPNIFAPHNVFEVIIDPDDLFEPQEEIVVSLRRPNTLHPPEPFNGTKTESAENSVVRTPDDDRIIFDLQSTKIIIRGDTELVVVLIVPDTVREGEMFLPQLTVSQRVVATFFVESMAGTATSGSDFDYYGEEISFAGTELALNGPSSVSTIADNMVEPNETVNMIVELSSPNSLGDLITFANKMALVTILDSDTAIIGFTSVTVDVDEDKGPASVTVAVLGDALASNAQVTIRLYTEAGTASAGEFGAIDMELTFTGAQQMITVEIPIVNDVIFEDSETFTANLMEVTSNVNTQVNPSQATITIIDNDPVVLGFDSPTYSASETQGSVTLTVEVTEGVPVDGFVMQWQATAGSAQAGSDFSGVDGTFTLSSTQSTYTFTVTIEDDDVVEVPEDFSVSLTRVTQEGRISITPDMATVSITDDDELVLGFSATSYSGSEGASVTPRVEVKSGHLAPSLSVDVTFGNSGGTATAGADYRAVTSTLTFTSIVEEHDVPVALLPDDLFEDQENFFANLVLGSTTHSVRIDTDQAQINIMDESAITFGFTVSDRMIDEDVGTVTLQVSVIAGSGTLQRSVDLTYSTVTLPSGNVATSDIDYTSATGTLSFDSSTTTIPITLSITPDFAVENDEVFGVMLATTVPRVTLNPSSATITISNDDKATIGFDMAAYKFDEVDGAGTMNVAVLSGELDISVTVLVSTIAGTATAGSDFVPIMSQSLVFSSTVTSVPLTLDIVVSEIVEDDETLSAALMLQDSSLSSDIQLAPMSTDILIRDTGLIVIGFSPSTYSIVESDGTVDLTIQVLSGELGKSVQVNLETLGHGLIGDISGSAMDLTPISQLTLTFSDNSPQTISINITPDMKLEMDENFFAKLSLVDADPNIVLSPSQAQITIENDDMVEIGFKVIGHGISEDLGYVDLTFGIRNNVIISGSSDPVEVRFEALAGTATDPSDYSCGPPKTYTFTSVDTEFTVRCTIADDAVSEDVEMFTANLTTSSPNVVLSPDNTYVQITDDDNVQFSFDRPVYMVEENDGNADIIVVKSGNSDYPRSIRLTGTVENGVNITEDLVFGPGQTTMTVSVPLVDDDITLEAPLQFPLSLEIPVFQFRVELGNQPTSVLEVADEDILTLRLQAPLIIEEGQVDYTVSVIADKDVATSLTINVFTVSNMTAGVAQEGEDYVGFSETVILNPGLPLNEQFFAMIVNDDRLEQLNEPFEIRMELAQQPAFGIVDLAVEEVNVIIQDDDALAIGFKTIAYSVIEDVGSLSFEVEVKNSGMFAVPIDFTVTDAEGEALRVLDYSKPDSLSGTIQPGQASVQYSVTIVNDTVTEVDEETFKLILQAETSRVSVLSGFDTSTVTITDDDSVTLGFSETKYTVGENDTVVQVCVSILEGSLAADRDITATLETMENTAMESSDFTAFNQTFTLSSTKTSECFDVEIVPDNLFEMDEIFEVLLSSTDSSTDLNPENTEITIVDDDGVRVSFKVDQYTYREGDGQAFVEVVLTGDTAVDVVVSVTGGPSSQMNIGPDRVVFRSNVTFMDGGPKEQVVSAVIQDDEIALEDDELVGVSLTILSPASGVNLGSITHTQVTIVDNDVLTIELTPSQLHKVLESVGTTSLCVNKSSQTIVDVTLDLQYKDDTASAGSDYNIIVTSVAIPANKLEECFPVEIVNDTVVEDDTDEKFYVDVAFSGTASVSVGPPSTFEVRIMDDEPIGRVCTLSDALILQTFTNSIVMGHNFSMSEGCERKLVTTCDEEVLDLEIRVDFFQGNFSSTIVSIFYEGETVIIGDDFTLGPETPPISEIVYMPGVSMASVSIPEIMFSVTRNLTALTISADNITLPLAGLCGCLDGMLYYPDCNSTVDPGESVDLLKQAYKVKPSDQILRGERKGCGMTANDTVIGDPLMTVPINTPGNMSGLHLCYEIHGAADQYFNLVSDECTSVNAHYVQVPTTDLLNIIDSMSFVAVDKEGVCHRIRVDVENCSAYVDGVSLRPANTDTSAVSYKFENDGISVRAYTSRVRIAVPNCADNSLVMWVFCQRLNMEHPETGLDIGPVDMIKFEITRGLNLKETSHGLIGQFWNIPVEVNEYTGVVHRAANSSGRPYYTVTVNYPLSTPRSFTGVLYDLTWEFESKKCLYVGNRQGGPIGEVEDPNDSVIEGSYQDYVTGGAFMTKFTYAVFKESNNC